MAKSEKLYEDIKHFFYEKDEYEFVIEISDCPMSEWKLVYVLTDDEMCLERRRLIKSKTGFAGFEHSLGSYNFYYADENFFKSEKVKAGEIIAFVDLTFCPIDLKKVAKELRELFKVHKTG